MTKNFKLDQFVPYFRHIAAVATDMTDAENIAYGMAVVFKNIHGCGPDFIEDFQNTALEYFENGDFTADDIVM